MKSRNCIACSKLFRLRINTKNNFLCSECYKKHGYKNKYTVKGPVITTTEYNIMPELNESKYWDILLGCSSIAKQRENEYGDVESNFKQILEVLNAISAKKWTLQDYCDVMLATKLASRKFNPKHFDNDKDLINYTAIALHLKQSETKK
jgi:hypothetical protein